MHPKDFMFGSVVSSAVVLRRETLKGCFGHEALPQDWINIIVAEVGSLSQEGDIKASTLQSQSSLYLSTLGSTERKLLPDAGPGLWNSQPPE